MIGSIVRRVRRARAHKKFEQVHERFRAAPDIQFVSYASALFCDEASKQILAKSIREGCDAALNDMGLVGPWADEERRSLAIVSMMSLLRDVVPDDVLKLAFADHLEAGADV